jgi:hypothetical protein
MKSKISSRTGCIAAVAFFFLIAISSSWYYRHVKEQSPRAADGISWAAAVEKCKNKYEAYRPAGQINAPNCRKRTEDADYFYFSWSKPLAIFVKKSNGQTITNSGKCQVSRKSGEIVYMTLGKTVLVNKLRKKK